MVGSAWVSPICRGSSCARTGGGLGLKIFLGGGASFHFTLPLGKGKS